MRKHVACGRGLCCPAAGGELTHAAVCPEAIATRHLKDNMRPSFDVTLQVLSLLFPLVHPPGHTEGSQRVCAACDTPTGCTGGCSRGHGAALPVTPCHIQVALEDQELFKHIDTSGVDPHFAV